MSGFSPPILIVIVLCLMMENEKKKSLARPLQQAMISHLETSPESKATGVCNTIVRVPTVHGFRLVAQNTESEVCFHNANRFLKQLLKSPSPPSSPPKKKSLRRSECTDRKLASSISNPQYSL